MGINDNTDENNFYMNSKELTKKIPNQSFKLQNFGIVVGQKTTPDIEYMTGQSRNTTTENTSETTQVNNNNTEER